MVDPMRSIRVSEEVWQKAKHDAIDHDLTLQQWVALCLLQGTHDGAGREDSITELRVIGEGIKR